jgi:hypothetical protein
MRIEWDFVKKLLRTLPGNRCKVRAHEGVAKPIPHNGHGQSVQGLPERPSALDDRTPDAVSAGGPHPTAIG